jgi:polysaccharide export outer membrane protein
MNCMQQLMSGLILAIVVIPVALAQSNYSMGAGDQVRLSVYGQPELATEGQINTDGTLEVPLLGAVKIAGRSSGDAAKLIAERYQTGNFVKSAQVNLLITQYRSHVVSILGKVNRPGKLVLEGSTSLTQAIAWAGGVADSGSERLILVRTDSNGRQERREYDLQKLMGREADASPVVWLQDGDTLYIPPRRPLLCERRSSHTGHVRARPPAECDAGHWRCRWRYQSRERTLSKTLSQTSRWLG